jgi:hypothetical protein
VVKDFRPPEPTNNISIEQKRWQDLVSGIVISFEVICCLLSATNKFMLFIGVGGAIGFALLFFNRQFREKYLGYQGDRSLPVTTTAKFKNTPPKIEQSLLLWTMVVLLAVTASIGLDLATHATFSFLAIPFGVAGSLWSYRRRHLTKHPLTYLVSALAIVLILTCLGSAFWGQTIEKAKSFLGSDRDLVLPLATGFLLVAVQLARMWSLGYQRGLASSVVISSMLMVSTVLIGNNFGFLLVLALFVGLLVPTLMLFYRSKINLKPIGLSIVPRPQQLTERHVPWKHLIKIAATAVVLGCTLSLFAPQLRLPDISWDLPGVDQVVKNLPIQTDPDLSNPGIRKAAEREGITDNGSSREGNSPAKGNFGNGNRENTGQIRGDGKPGITGQANSGTGAESQQSDGNDNDSGFIDERLARQAIHNILATADRPLKTNAERKAYIQKYLQEHIQSPDCGSNNAYCFNGSLNSSWSDRLTDQDQTSLARWNPTPQTPLRPYYDAQQPTPPPLMRQLTTPCPVDQKDCYKYRVFQANKQESIRTHNRLLRSIGGIDLTEDNLDNQSGSQGSGSPGNAANKKNSSQNSGVVSGKNGNERNGETAKSFPGSSDRNQKVTPKNTTNPGSDRIPNPTPDQAKPQPENSSSNSSEQKSPEQPPKLPPISAEQLTNLLRITAVILMLFAGVAWYLWLQSRQEKIAKQKERKFNQLPTIERIYWLMLKELHISGSIKQSNETEWEFALAKTQQITINELQYPGLLGKLITEISGDYVAWRYGKKTPNDSSLNHKFERFRELHSEFYREFQSAEKAKSQAASSIISQAKKTLYPVK